MDQVAQAHGGTRRCWRYTRRVRPGRRQTFTTGSGTPASSISKLNIRRSPEQGCAFRTGELPRRDVTQNRQSRGTLGYRKISAQMPLATMTCGVGVAFVIPVPVAAHCARPLCSPTPPAPISETDDFWTRPYLFGSINGTPDRRDRGICPWRSDAWRQQTIGNLSRRRNRNTATQAGQLCSFQAKFDLAKLTPASRGANGLSTHWSTASATI